MAKAEMAALEPGKGQEIGNQGQEVQALSPESGHGLRAIHI